MPIPDLYAVFGHPIGHSKSPYIHALFAKQTDQFMSYSSEEVLPEDFEQRVRKFFQAGGQGLNCTVPLKELAFSLADQKSQRAELSKAVNTLALRADGTIDGDNTDGIGLMRDLCHNWQIPLQARRILLLGAGGASRGIIAPILEQCQDRLVVANRTPEKAMRLAMEFGDLGPISGCGFKELTGQTFDLVINATAASLSGEVPELPEKLLTLGACCYDLAYGNRPTAFVEWGEKNGAALSVDGIGMLVEQAAESFAIWRGIRPETRPVIEALNAERRSQGLKLRVG